MPLHTAVLRKAVENKSVKVHATIPKSIVDSQPRYILKAPLTIWPAI